MKPEVMDDYLRVHGFDNEWQRAALITCIMTHCSDVVRGEIITHLRSVLPEIHMELMDKREKERCKKEIKERTEHFKKEVEPAMKAGKHKHDEGMAEKSKHDEAKEGTGV